MVKIELRTSVRLLYSKLTAILDFSYRNVGSLSRPGSPWSYGIKKEGVMGSSGVVQQAHWLVENGLKELESLFRTVLYHPSQPILVVDSDRNCLDANSGAGRLLGLPRDQIIGRKIDDFVDPPFLPELELLWVSFLDRGEQEGTFPLV